MARNVSETILRMRRAADAQGIVYRDLPIEGFHERIPVVEIDPSKLPSKRALLIAGTHGDEPAGVEAIARFAEEGRWRAYPGVRFKLYPCVNPLGFDAGTRQNADGADINRSFRGAGTPESRSIRADLDGASFDCYYDMHEDIDASGFYLYEVPGGHDWGPKIIDAVSKAGPILASGIPEPDFPYEVKDGLIQFPADALSTIEDMEEWPFGLYLHRRCDTVGQGAETPGKLPEEQRVKMHLAGLDRMLELLSRA